MQKQGMKKSMMELQMQFHKKWTTRFMVKMAIPLKNQVFEKIQRKFYDKIQKQRQS